MWGFNCMPKLGVQSNFKNFWRLTYIGLVFNIGEYKLNFGGISGIHRISEASHVKFSVLSWKTKPTPCDTLWLIQLNALILWITVGWACQQKWWTLRVEKLMTLQVSLTFCGTWITSLSPCRIKKWNFGFVLTLGQRATSFSVENNGVSHIGQVSRFRLTVVIREPRINRADPAPFQVK